MTILLAMSRPLAAAAVAAPERVTSRSDADLATARTLVRALDTYQVDPIVGLFIPGLGDLITLVVGGFLVVVAARRGVPAIVLARMLLNLGVDTAVGAIPIAGDVADFALRANAKNLKLLEDRSVTRKATWKDWAAVAGAAALVIGTLVLAIWLLVSFLSWVF